MSIQRLFPAILVMASAAVAHATPNDNFRLGTVVQVESATADTGNGARTSTGSSRITKSGGSFDFTMRAADFGIELPVSINLRGYVLANGRIVFDINNSYSPGVDLGGGQILSRVTGRITMRALPVLGIERQDIGNVRLALAADSQLVASGSWGSTTIAISHLYLLGGVPQPTLSTFTDPSTTRICSGRVPVYRQLRVLLTGSASATGASVELDELTDRGVHVPPTVVVRRGARTADLRARIEAGYVGRVRLTAAAGGIMRALDIDVRPAIECMSR